MAVPILDVRHLSVSYQTAAGPLQAVRDLSFQIPRGETLALVGETGCGKSTVAMALLGLLETGAIESGEVFFEGRDLRKLEPRDWRKIRGRKIGVVFQDARGALNPVLTIGAHLAEAMRAHRRLSGKQARPLSADLLLEAGIADPLDHMRMYPFELSGGTCQRICIALGICNSPSLLIADEPTSALDPTLQMQIMELLREMKRRHRLSLLLISHDLALVSEFADYIAVMYHSRLVEYGPGRTVLDNPAHPYTRALREAVPDMTHNCNTRPLTAVPGVTPVSGEDLPGCPFAPRCGYTEPRCSQAFPESVNVTDGHWVACIKEFW